MKIIGIIGSRSRNSEEDFQICYKVFLEHYSWGDSIVSGGAKQGGDNFAERIAELLNFDEPTILKGGETILPEENKMYIHEADWELLGKRAGFIRNGYIARDCDILIAVYDSKSKGTLDTITKTKKLDKEIIII